MKKMLFLVLIATLLSCTCGETEQPEKQSRIKLKETTIIEGRQYFIIEVDYKEYLTSSDGGFIKISE